jgi:hypothetical protein
MLRPLQKCPWLRIAITLALAAVLFGAADAAWACPNCKEGLAQNDPHGQSIAAGYYYSILFMLSMPFIIITTFGAFAYRSVKKAQAQHDAADANEAPGSARG